MPHIEPWREVWRRGFVPHLSTEHLQTVRRGLLLHDARLLQGATTSPPPLLSVQDWPAEGACLTGYGFAFEDDTGELRGHGPRISTKKVAEVEEFFARVCFQVDQELNEPAACRHFLNWYDEAPRDEMIRQMLAEVNLALRQRDVDEPIYALAK